MGLLVSILGILVLVLGYTTFNLLRKNEKQEDVLAQYLTYMDNISKQIEYSDVKLNQIDAKGIFKSDDEIGWFFEQIKNLQLQLNNFKLLDDGRSKK
jgi:hypothetical protein